MAEPILFFTFHHLGESWSEPQTVLNIVDLEQNYLLFWSQYSFDADIQNCTDIKESCLLDIDELRQRILLECQMICLSNYQITGREQFKHLPWKHWVSKCLFYECQYNFWTSTMFFWINLLKCGLQYLTVPIKPFEIIYNSVYTCVKKCLYTPDRTFPLLILNCHSLSNVLYFIIIFRKIREYSFYKVIGNNLDST